MLKKPDEERQNRRIAGYVTPAVEEKIRQLVAECGYRGVSDVLRHGVEMLYRSHQAGEYPPQAKETLTGV